MVERKKEQQRRYLDIEEGDGHDVILE